MKIKILALAGIAMVSACKSSQPNAEPEAAPAQSAGAPTAATTHDLKGEEVSYSAGDTTLKGYLVYDANQQGPRPGVLVVHEWWGHNEYTRERARMLARLGYTALAVDMYGDGKQAAHPDDAMKFSSEVAANAEGAKQRFEAAMKLLQEHPTTNADKIAAIGYCFGGAVVLNMARMGVDLDAVASFHGNLTPKQPAQPGVIKGKVFVAHGAADPFIPDAQVEAFKKEMDAAQVDYTFVAYPDAKHAFTNPDATALGEKFNLPLAYQKEADVESWKTLEKILEEAFGT